METYIIIILLAGLLCGVSFIAGYKCGEQKSKNILLQCKTTFNKILAIMPPEKYNQLHDVVSDFYDKIRIGDDKN